MNKTIAIDFDGTIHDKAHPAAHKRMGPPILGAKEALTAFKAKGYNIIIFTVNNKWKHIEEWIHYFQIPYDEITNIKPNADYFIYHKAIAFKSWADINSKNL